MFGKCFSSACFFFQAEDGIRDDLVTGVQTCALPIWRCCFPRREGRFFGAPGQKLILSKPAKRSAELRFGAETRQRVASLCARSEERRVGKECRSRWWRYHLKEK